MANPMYRQIAEDLRAQIESGGLAPGQQLRTELELREKYNASRNTVRDAIKWLTNLGLVETKPGQGTFVVQKIDPFVTTLTGDAADRCGGDRSLLPVGSQQGMNESRRSARSRSRSRRPRTKWPPRCEIKKGAEVISRHERRFIDGNPWSMQTSYYPMEFADRGAERLRSPRNIDEGTVSVSRELSASARSDTATGLPYDRRTLPKRTSSSYRPMAGCRCTR